MIQKIILTLTVALACVSASWAASYKFDVNGIYYQTVVGGVEVTYKGIGWNLFDEYSGYVVIPQKVKVKDTVGNEFEFPVVGIGASAFAGSSVRRVSIPTSVTYIGQGAFGSCAQLEELHIPNTVTSLGSFLCHDCTSLTDVTLSTSAKMIQEVSFTGCTGLKEIDLTGVTFIGNEAFSGCGFESLTIPASVETIGTGAFRNCNSLTRVNYNAVNCAFLDTYGSPTFSNSKIERVIVGDGVESIPNNAFQFCSKMTLLRLPETLKSIGARAFSNCYRLKSVIIPSSVTTIDAFAFGDCQNLYWVTSMALTPPLAATTTFSNVHPDACLFVDRNSVEAYKNSCGWEDLRVRKGRRNKAFIYELDSNGEGTVCLVDYDDYQSEYVTVPSTIDIDGVNYTVMSMMTPFTGCSQIKCLHLPSTMVSTGFFDGLTSLEMLQVDITTPPYADSERFADVPEDCVLVVPDGSESAYAKASGWSRFTTIRGGVSSATSNSTGFRVTGRDIMFATACRSVEIYNLAGQLVASASGIEPGSVMSVATAGVYIVKTPNGVGKVLIK